MMPSEVRRYHELLGGEVVDVVGLTFGLAPSVSGDFYLTCHGDAKRLGRGELRTLARWWRKATLPGQTYCLVLTSRERRFAEWFGFVLNGTTRVGDNLFWRMTYDGSVCCTCRDSSCDGSCAGSGGSCLEAACCL